MIDLEIHKGNSFTLPNNTTNSYLAQTYTGILLTKKGSITDDPEIGTNLDFSSEQKVREANYEVSTAMNRQIDLIEYSKYSDRVYIKVQIGDEIVEVLV